MNDANDMNDSPWTRTETQTRQTGRHWQRIRVLLGTAAAVLVVALLAGTLLTRMHGTTSGLGNYSPPKGACAPGAIKTHVPANSAFGALDMVSPDEGWALGAITDPSSGVPVSGFILHYTHCSWTPIYMYPAGAGLSSISMGSATDGWAVGSTNSGAPYAMQITNGSLRIVTPPPGADALHGGSYSSVRMLSSDEGWIIFNRVKDSGGNSSQGLLHLVNGKWIEIDTPFPAMETVLPVAPNEAWVVGYATKTQQTPDMYHYQAGTWTRTALPSEIMIYTMRMVSPNDIWASGVRDVQSSSGIEAAVLHYDGSQWRQVPLSASGDPQDVEAFDQDTAWAFTQDTVTMTKGNTPPTSAATIGSAQYQSDGTWRQVAWPFANISLIGSLTRVSTDEYWAVGFYWVESQTPTGNGGYSGSGYTVGVLLYFANGAWHRYAQ